MENYRATQNCELEVETLLACLDIGKLLTSTLELDQILNLIMKKVSRLIPARNWSLLLRDKESEELKFEVVVGIDPELVKNIQIPFGKGIAGIAAQTGAAVFVADAANDPRVYRAVDKMAGFVTKSIVCIPLAIHEKVLGVMELVNVDDIEEFKSNRLQVLQILADYAAIAIENAHYVASAQEMSITDEYTGLHNARYLHEFLEHSLQEARKNNRHVAAVFMDVDNFKLVVDTHGHLAGSQVLKEIGQTIQSSLSKNEFLFKYGGDEYVLILPGKDKQAALELIGKILEKIRATEYLKTGGTSLKVTSSFGIAVFPDDASNKKDLLLKADHSMYKIKKSTKNGIGTT